MVWLVELDAVNGSQCVLARVGRRSCFELDINAKVPMFSDCENARASGL